MIWKQHNSCVFDGARPSVPQLTASIRDEATLWARAGAIGLRVIIPTDWDVIANDFKAQRCDLLIHNTKRMCTANLIVTNHDAQNFPSCSLAKDHSEIYKGHHKPQRLEFDCVLCDVPCSGDGTIRKNHDMWRKWNSSMGNGFHLLQVNIAMRGKERHRSKDGCSCAYRLSYEGLSLLFPYMRKRILYASPVDFQKLLQYRTINFAHFADARFGEEASSLMPGCCVVVLCEGHQNADSVAMDPSTIAIVCWRGKSTMNVLVSPPDRKELLEYRFGFKAFKFEDEKSNNDINGLHEVR
uniref:Uncharacterized protein n=1 Tax=Avena sativa TaxID=4498 RepID=A0ACD6AI17_AVESA